MKIVREHIYEAFSEKGDPIKDMGIGISEMIKKALNKAYNFSHVSIELLDRTGKDHIITLAIKDYADQAGKNIDAYKKFLSPFYSKIYIKDRSYFRTIIIVKIKKEYDPEFMLIWYKWVNDTFYKK